MPRVSPLVFAAVICGGLLRPMPAGAGQLLIEEAAYYREQGRQAQAAGRIDEAIEAYRKATLSFPDYAEAYNDLGVAYEAKGDPARAEAAYLTALRINPQHGAAQTNLALLYESQGRMDQAVAHWQERVRLGPGGDPWVRQARDHLIQHGASVPEPRGALDAKRRGEIAPAHHEEGRFRASRHQRAEDQEAFQRVPDRDPGHRGARQGLERARRQAQPQPPRKEKPTERPLSVPVGTVAPAPSAPPAASTPAAPSPITGWPAEDAPTSGTHRREAMDLWIQRQKPAPVPAPSSAPPVIPAAPARPMPPSPPRAAVPSAVWQAASVTAPPSPPRATPPPSAVWQAASVTAPTVRVAPVKVITTPAEARALADQLAREKEQARSLMVRELYQRGLLLSRQQQYAQAIEQFQRALSIDPNHRESQQSLREAQAALAHSQR